MPNYQEGKIYKIYNTINDDIYIGSTTQKLCERMRGHRSRITYKDNHKPIYQSVLEHGIEHFFIELIEKYPCSDKDELRKKEGEYIRLLKPPMNKIIAGRTDYEYQEDNREHKKEYYQNNKEYMNEYMKQYRKNNKEYTSQKEKEYREHNKYFIKACRSEKITCECGCDVTRNHLARHKRSAKHKQSISEINKNILSYYI